MNRMAPLITRRTGRFAPVPTLARPWPLEGADAPAPPGDLRLFATSFAAGLVIFGTFLS